MAAVVLKPRSCDVAGRFQGHSGHRDGRPRESEDDEQSIRSSRKVKQKTRSSAHDGRG